MKKRTLKKVLQFGILLFGIPLLLWNCEKETLDFNKPDNLVLDISNQFNSEDFKELLPHQFLVDWSHSEKQFSEDLNDYFYEFSIIYKDKRFNPVTINKVSPRNYYHKYKIIVLEKEKGTYSFHLAKFFQEKDIQNTSLIDLEVTFNQKTGYNGLVHLYDNEGQRVFESYIYKNEKEKKAKSSNKELYKVTNQNCITIVTAHYNDYYQHIYDAFGNYLGYIFLYTEFSHYSTREECSDVVEPDYDGFEGGQSICMGSCIDIADIVEQIFCPNGDPVDADGNCDGYGEDVTPNEEPLQEQLLQIQQDYIIDLLSIDRGTPEMNWVNNDNNNVAITQIYEYLQINSFDNNIGASINSFVMQVISAWIETNNTADIDFYNQIINNELTGKEKCLNDHLQNLGNDFVGNLLGNFEGDGSEYSINIESKNNVYITNSNGNTTEVNAKTIYTSNSNVIRIEISGSKAISNRALQVTRTLLHEYIHADIFRKLYTSNPTSDDLDFRETFNSYENNNFEPSPSHQTMADLYLENMKNALKSFHQTVMLGDYNYLSDNGQISLDNFYEALAWQGLKNHGVQAWIDLTQERKDEIDQSYQQYIFSTTHNCP